MSVLWSFLLSFLLKNWKKTHLWSFIINLSILVIDAILVWGKTTCCCLYDSTTWCICILSQKPTCSWTKVRFFLSIFLHQPIPDSIVFWICLLHHLLVVDIVVPFLLIVGKTSCIWLACEIDWTRWFGEWRWWTWQCD